MVAPPASAAATATPSEDIKPYTIHVSSKYLDLTREKLELTRLPRGSEEPKSEDWWEPKAEIEPLIDHWLEQHSWRDEERKFNDTLPQFRTSVTIPSAAGESAVRVHLIHVKSPHPQAIPLLLIPPFPFTNLSFGHLIPGLTEPEDPTSAQPFHVVIPAIPGTGFSDALPNNVPVIPTTARIMDLVMTRLEYQHYLASNAGPSSASPSDFDSRLTSHLATHFQDSCLGAHLIAPPLKAPALQTSPLDWVKWIIINIISRFFAKPIFGYTVEDYSSLDRLSIPNEAKKQPAPKHYWYHMDAAREPNTLAYALCDSPTGLLLFVLMMLKTLGPQKTFTPSEIVTLTELAWLPGPEAPLRALAQSALHEEKGQIPAVRPRVGITVFMGDQATEDKGVRGGASDWTRIHEPYTPPAWGNTHFEVLSSNRVAGRPGLLAWERPEIIAQGSRNLAAAILAKDGRLRPSRPGIEALQQVIVDGDTTIRADLSGTTVQTGASSSQKVAVEAAHNKSETNEAPQFLAPPPRDARPVTPPGQSPRRSADNLADVDEDEDASNQSSPDTVIALRTNEPVVGRTEAS